MDVNGKDREHIRELVRDALSRDDMTEADIADMVTDETIAALERATRDRAITLNATFLPATPADKDTLPMIMIAGSQVYAYVLDGELCVTVDTKNAASRPLRVHVNDGEAFAADGDGYEWRRQFGAAKSVHYQAEFSDEPLHWLSNEAPLSLSKAREVAASMASTTTRVVRVTTTREIIGPTCVNCGQPVHDTPTGLAHDDTDLAHCQDDAGLTDRTDTRYATLDYFDLGAAAADDEAHEARIAAWMPAPDGEALLCDECWEDGTGLLAECQDVCNLPLEHHGECADHWRSRVQETCDRCGKTDRLTREDVSNLDFDR